MTNKEKNKKNENKETEETAKTVSEAAKAEKETEEVKEEAQKTEKNAKTDKKLKSKVKSLEDEISKLKAEIEEKDKKYLLLAAEYDNFRRRSKEEKDGIYADAAADALKEMMPLIDNLERATAYTDAEKVAEGLEMILGTLPAVFEKMGVATFGEAGEKFDPNLHNAIMHEDDAEKGENEIADVFQKGYKIGDKVIRYAMVKVVN